MDRRMFNKLAGMSAVGTMTSGHALHAHGMNAAGAAQIGTEGEIVLEDKELLVAFDKASGALTRMVRKSTNWIIERRPELAVSFRLLVPLPKQRANFIPGQKQRASSVEKIAENRVEIVWKNPVSEHGGAISLT